MRGYGGIGCVPSARCDEAALRGVSIAKMLDWKIGTVSTAAAIRTSSAAFFIFSPRIRIGPGAREKIDGFEKIEAKANTLLGKGSKRLVRFTSGLCRTGGRYRFRGIVIGEPDLRRGTGNGIGTLAEH